LKKPFIVFILKEMGRPNQDSATKYNGFYPKIHDLLHSSLRGILGRLEV
jgi:hypothetical protein